MAGNGAQRLTLKRVATYRLAIRMSRDLRMPLYVEDPQVDEPAARLMTLLGTTKAEAVRCALQNEIARQTGKGDLAERTADFVQALHKRAGPERMPTDRAFIDFLHERG